VDPGSNVRITVDAGKFPNWKELEFYDGAKKLGTVTAAPAQYTATNLTPGYHVFSVLGTDAKGNIRTSDPVLIVVRQYSPPFRAATGAKLPMTFDKSFMRELAVADSRLPVRLGEAGTCSASGYPAVRGRQCVSAS
jgi:hypothetical protein